MWFSNLRLFRLTKPFSQTPEELGEALEAHAFRGCGSLELSSYGWVPPMGRHGSALVHAANGNIMICARKEEKILPAAAIRELVNEKALEIEEMQARPVRRKERDAIKDEIIQDLLPRALKKSSLTFAYISPRDNLVVINTAGANKAEELLSYLRGSVGSLALVPISLIATPTAVMTRWLTGEVVPAEFELLDECELREKGDDGSIIRCKRQDLASDEIQVHLDAGKQAVKLAVSWQEHVSCIINDDFSLKRLKFGEEVLEKSGEADDADPIAVFDQDFTIMTLELARFIPKLIEAFGGENAIEQT